MSCIEDLPEPLMVEILSRLPVKTIFNCKCVCKKWLNIVSSSDSYFADRHLSRSPACFMAYYLSEKESHRRPGIIKLVEVEDHHNLHHFPVMSLDLKLVSNLNDSLIIPVGSVNGLVCLRQFGRYIDNTYICNPITREYTILPWQQCSREPSAEIVYCFGVGSLTQKYKVIRIFQKSCCIYTQVEVYTLGTSQWRSLGYVPYEFIERYGQFLNGHAHWTIGYQNSGENICSFNFDNETFELFPSPPSEATREIGNYFPKLGALKGCLCRCHTYMYKLTIWVMKEYGIKKSWHKELVIEISISPIVGMKEPAFPVEVFKDGTILMATPENNLIVYCPRRKAIIETKIFDGHPQRKSIIETKICDGSFRLGMAYRPTFHRLQNFENVRVHVF